VIEQLVPPGARAAELFGDVDGRPGDAAGRLADQLLRAARAGSGLRGHGPAGEPLWPAGFRGSITHCDGYIAVVVAAEADLPCLGVDAEPAAPLPDGVLAEIALPAELRRLARIATWDASVPWDRLLFCAKEAVYKAWYPAERSWLDFADIEVWFGSRQLRMMVRSPAGGRVGYRGSWLSGGGLLVVAVTGRCATTLTTLPSGSRKKKRRTPHSSSWSG
jgi:4'-phosphopantetheinyl transferase EntD